MTREITDHKLNGLNDALKIEALDEAGHGNASHLYRITGFNTETNASDPFVERYGQPAQHSTILFQNGPIAEHGVNGVSNEALLAVVIDRLRCFQAGQFHCKENANALIHLESALLMLKSRTFLRMVRGVEGTNQK